MAQTKTWNTTIKVRLDPTPAQAAFFDENFNCCRYLWNQMLSDQIRFYTETDAHFIPTPAKYKKDAPFLKEADSNALVSVHQNLHKAFQRFFSNPSRYRHPTFKSKKRCKNSYTTYCQYYRSGKGTSIYLTGSCQSTLASQAPALVDFKNSNHQQNLVRQVLLLAGVCLYHKAIPADPPYPRNHLGTELFIVSFLYRQQRPRRRSPTLAGAVAR